MSHILEFEDNVDTTEYPSCRKGSWYDTDHEYDAFNHLTKGEKKNINKFLKRRIKKSPKIKKLEQDVKKLKKEVKKFKNNSIENEIAELINCDNKEQRRKLVKKLMKSGVI